MEVENHLLVEGHAQRDHAPRHVCLRKGTWMLKVIVTRHVSWRGYVGFLSDIQHQTRTARCRHELDLSGSGKEWQELELAMGDPSIQANRPSKGMYREPPCPFKKENMDSMALPERELLASNPSQNSRLFLCLLDALGHFANHRFR